MIKILDYGVGNIYSFLNMFKRLNIPAESVSTLDGLSHASKLILPGVGAFDHAMERFNNSGMRSRVEELVLGEKVPILGVCVGMQMLAKFSEEGKLPGLNWLPGRVVSFSGNVNSSGLPSPHMGWNDVAFGDNSIFKDKDSRDLPRFYFLHSYYFAAENKCHVDGTAEYGVEFEAAVKKDNIYGVQFHPEKSHSWGSQLLQKFAEL